MPGLFTSAPHRVDFHALPASRIRASACGSPFLPGDAGKLRIQTIQRRQVDGRKQMASAAEAISTISVTKLHPLIGAEIGGIDLRYPLDDDAIRQIKDVWHRHTT